MRLLNPIKTCGGLSTSVVVYNMHQTKVGSAKYKIAILQALLLVNSLCSVSFSVLCWAC